MTLHMHTQVHTHTCMHRAPPSSRCNVVIILPVLMIFNLFPHRYYTEVLCCYCGSELQGAEQCWQTIDHENFSLDAIYSTQSVSPFMFKSQRVTFSTRSPVLYTYIGGWSTAVNYHEGRNGQWCFTGTFFTGRGEPCQRLWCAYSVHLHCTYWDMGPCSSQKQVQKVDSGMFLEVPFNYSILKRGGGSQCNLLHNHKTPDSSIIITYSSLAKLARSTVCPPM